MQDIEPFYNWRHIYTYDEDKKSPFFGREYSEFEYSKTVYNYYIHPQWDDFGSHTLYAKILMADYEEGYAIIELLGEWNDAIENDFMFLKQEVIEKLMDENIFHFILIAENVLNFHSDTNDYYVELFEELIQEKGWCVCVNMPSPTQYDFKKLKLHQYLPLVEINEWRTYKPYHLFKKIVRENLFLM